jgi:hypothetical protein
MNGRALERLNPLKTERLIKTIKARIEDKKMAIKICIGPSHAPRIAIINKSPYPNVCLWKISQLNETTNAINPTPKIVPDIGTIKSTVQII